MNANVMRGICGVVGLVVLPAGAVAQQCEAGERVGYIGVMGLQCNCSNAVADGGAWVFRTEPAVTGVADGSPAAGRLETGDVIVAADGYLITTSQGGRRYGAATPGTPLRLTVRRGERLIEVPVTPTAVCPDDERVAFQPVTAVTVAAGRLLTLRGAMADQTGNLVVRVLHGETAVPLSDVNVSVVGTRPLISGITNAQGTVVLRNVPAGERRINAQLIGHGRAQQAVTIVPGSEAAAAVLQLAPRAVEIEGMVVTGTATGTNLRERANTVGVISAAEIERAGAVNFEDLLRGRARGVTISGAVEPRAIGARTQTVTPVAPISPNTGWFGFAITCTNCGWEMGEGASDPRWAFEEPPRLVMVEPGSPAARAGLRVGDVLTHIDGVSITTADGGGRFGAVKPGQTVRWTYRRGETTGEVSITAIERPESSRASLEVSQAALRSLQMSRAAENERRRTQMEEALLAARAQQNKLAAMAREREALDVSLRARMAESMPVRYTGTVGDVEVEVRGSGNVVTTIVQEGRHIVIETGAATIRLRSGGQER